MFHWMEASTLHKTSIQNVGGIHAEKLKCRSIKRIKINAKRELSHILVKKKKRGIACPHWFLIFFDK